MISMAFYWSLSFSQFFDVKRKDFWQMFIHHEATIILMCFSWVGNLTRIGSLVLLVHDCADIFLEVSRTYSFFIRVYNYVTVKVVMYYIRMYLYFRLQKWLSMLITRNYVIAYSLFSQYYGLSHASVFIHFG